MELWERAIVEEKYPQPSLSLALHLQLVLSTGVIQLESSQQMAPGVWKGQSPGVRVVKGRGMWGEQTKHKSHKREGMCGHHDSKVSVNVSVW